MICCQSLSSRNHNKCFCVVTHTHGLIFPLQHIDQPKPTSSHLFRRGESRLLLQRECAKRVVFFTALLTVPGEIGSTHAIYLLSCCRSSPTVRTEPRASVLSTGQIRHGRRISSWVQSPCAVCAANGRRCTQNQGNMIPTKWNRQAEHIFTEKEPWTSGF
jgi:hypothetical protein